MSDSSVKEYIRKANLADITAKLSREPDEQKSWERIAADYRMMALRAAPGYRPPKYSR